MMSKHDRDYAEMRADGAARFRQLEREARAMLDRTGLTSVEREGHKLMIAMAQVFARCMEINDPTLPHVLRHFAGTESDTERGMES
jgi:hypothetical protein